MDRTKFNTSAENLAATNAAAFQVVTPFNDHLMFKSGMNVISNNNLVPLKFNNIMVNLPKPLNGTETAIHRCLVHTKTVSVMATDGRMIPMQKKLTHIRQIIDNTHIPNLAIKGL